MNYRQYRNALKALGLSQIGASHLIGVHETTSRRWASQKANAEIPEPVARLLHLMIAYNISPADAMGALDIKTPSRSRPKSQRVGGRFDLIDRRESR